MQLARGAGFCGGARAEQPAAAARIGSTEPAASCGAAGGRLRGIGGCCGVIAVDFTFGRGGTARGANSG